MLSILTVLGKDRPGIIAGVTENLFRRGCNLEDISMTVLGGEFAMMMVVCMNASAKAAAESGFSRMRCHGGLDFFWKDFKAGLLRGGREPKEKKTLLISAIGRDHTGIVYKVSRILAGFHLNITDLNSKILGKGKSARTLYAMALEVEVPAKFNVRKLEKALQMLARSLKIEITLRPLEKIEF